MNRRRFHMLTHRREIWFTALTRHAGHARTPSEQLHCRVLVILNMGTLVTIDRTPWRAHRTECQGIGSRTRRHKKYGTVGLKNIAYRRLCRRGHGVLTIAR